MRKYIQNTQIGHLKHLVECVHPILMIIALHSVFRCGNGTLMGIIRGTS